MKRRTLITIVLLGVALAVCLVLYVRIQVGNTRFSINYTGPLDIRLWGIRPDAGDTIYDPNGNKVLDTLGIARNETTVWRDNLYRRDFIFEILDTNEPIAFLPLRYSANREEDRRGSFLKGSLYFERHGRNFGWFQTVIPRTKRQSFLFGIWKKEVPVDRIDLHLRYYYGPPNKPICVFKGPFEFEVDRKLHRVTSVTDETGLYELSFDLVPSTSASPSELVMLLSTKRQIDPVADILFYDAGDKCLYVRRGCPHKIPAGEGIGYSIPRSVLKNTAKITVGEQPFETTVRNLKLDSPNSERRTYAERFDKMVEILKSGRAPTRYVRHNFRDISELLKVIEVLRGEQICQVSRNLCFRRMGMLYIDPDTLDAEQSQKLKQVVLRWADAMDPEIRVNAIRLGLHCEWPEFFDMAFDLLEYPNRNYFDEAVPVRDIAEVLYSHREKLSERDINRIAMILPRLTNPNAIRRLLYCVGRPKSPARLTALWDMANSDRPWLWTDAIWLLLMWRELEGKYDSLSEKLKPRVFLVAGPNRFSNPAQIAPKVSELQLSLLSSQLLTHHGGTFSTLIARIPESTDKRAMTEVMIESLRYMEYRRDWSVWKAISRIARYLNLWHGMDIGGLGSDVRKEIPALDKMDLEAVAVEAIEWYDKKSRSADPNAER
jgi:hypothetical protein